MLLLLHQGIGNEVPAPPQSLAAVGLQPCPLRPQDNAHPTPGALAVDPPERRAQGREITLAAQPHCPTLCWGLTSSPEGVETGCALDAGAARWRASEPPQDGPRAGIARGRAGPSDMASRGGLGQVAMLSTGPQSSHLQYEAGR